MLTVKKLPDLYFVEPAKRFNTPVKIFDLIYGNCEIKMGKIRIVKKGCIEKESPKELNE
jgi:hypothetical protein